jgi:hypothetical protein
MDLNGNTFTRESLKRTAESDDKLFFNHCNDSLEWEGEIKTFDLTRKTKRKPEDETN